MNYSKQRSLILSILSQSAGHMTAEQVYQKAREHEPHISLGTVYRNLNVLSKNNEIRKINIAGANSIFDKNSYSHIHFRCIKCGRIQDISDTHVDNIIKNFEDNTGNIVYTNDIVLGGLCQKCKNRSK